MQKYKITSRCLLDERNIQTARQIYTKFQQTTDSLSLFFLPPLFIPQPPPSQTSTSTQKGKTNFLFGRWSGRKGARNVDPVWKTVLNENKWNEIKSADKPFGFSGRGLEVKNEVSAEKGWWTEKRKEEPGKGIWSSINTPFLPNRKSQREREIWNHPKSRT